MRRDAEARLLHANTWHCWSEATPDCCMIWSEAACLRHGQDDRPVV